MEPVLTAHPTEAKRLSVLEQHRVLHGLIQKLNFARSEISLQRLRREVCIALERLWRTGETHQKRPTIADERRNILYYLTEVYPSVLRRLDERLVEALELAGYSAEGFLSGRVKPELRFGTWVGGDRDGHPLVTAEVTRKTLRELRQEALRVQRRSLERLYGVLSLTERIEDGEGDFTAVFGTVPEEVEEPWRWVVSRILERLPEVDEEKNGEGRKYRNARELQAELRLLERGLRKIGATRLAEGDVFPAIRVAETFGFHLANLDIRQNSWFHRQAMGQILEAAGLPGKAYVE
ncbi:MAG: phosphoenolpyruvate carboxylase, partial [Chthoniobacterales bacterium]|nr:phosphoenolpyruvate carboxylase [Chthoniobacterales bacterium]